MDLTACVTPDSRSNGDSGDGDLKARFRRMTFSVAVGYILPAKRVKTENKCTDSRGYIPVVLKGISTLDRIISDQLIDKVLCHPIIEKLLRKIGRGNEKGKTSRYVSIW